MSALIKGPLRWVRSWELWTQPRHVLAYVVIVDILAAAAVLATSHVLPLNRPDAIRLAILGGCALVHIELSRSIERARKLTSGSGPFVDSLTLWDFAAVVVLPPLLACALIVVTHGYAWLRVWRGRRPLYRWVFSDATVLLASQAAAVVLLLGPGPHPGVALGPIGLLIILAAGLVRWFVNYALVVGAILASTPHLRAGQVMGEFGEQILEAGALGLGLAAAGLVEVNPYLLVGIVIGLVALHRGVLLAQFRKASRTDSKTGLHTAAWWHQIAEHAFTRARTTETGVALLMLDLDHFKNINDTHGHVAGDQVLYAVGQAINGEIRDSDTAGRWGGEEFVILIRAVDSTELVAIAERVRRRIHTLVVTDSSNRPIVIQDLTVSIGAASFPNSGINTLDDLVLAADSALYQAKKAGRDQIVTAD